MTASGKGAFDEYWGLSIQDCKSQCEQASGCLGVEYTAFGPSRPAGERSRCEQFKDLPLTHAVPASSAICLVADTPASRASWKSKIDGRAAHDAIGNQMMKGRTRQTHSSHRSDCIEARTVDSLPPHPPTSRPSDADHAHYPFLASPRWRSAPSWTSRGWTCAGEGHVATRARHTRPEDRRPAAVPTPARCELDGADLSKLNMNGVMFDRAELQGANLVEATAVGSTFFKATPSHSRSLLPLHTPPRTLVLVHPSCVALDTPLGSGHTTPLPKLDPAPPLPAPRPRR